MSSSASSWLSSVSNKGSYERKESQFRQWVKADGSTPFQPASGRYHLYVSFACPWAHRTLVTRALKGLEDAISVTVVDWFLDQAAGTGWTFTDQKEKCTKDPLHPEFTRLRQIYELTEPEYKGNVTVPVLFDSQTNRIVNNESSEIIRMLNSEFQTFAKNPQLDLYPEPLRAAIDEANAWVYPGLNNGVYRCGFATSQQAYDEAIQNLITNLERLNGILSKQRYLAGDGKKFTEADVRLFTTLIRFDAVYYHHFKCNYKRISEYPAIHAYMCEIYQIPAITKDVNFTHIRSHYEHSHRSINPHGIISIGPSILSHLLTYNHERDVKFPIQ